MLRFTNSLALVGLTFGINGIAQIVMSYPAGRMADTFGRRPVLIFGLLLQFLGFVLIYYSVVSWSFWIFVSALVIYGLSWGATSQVTVAVMDMYPRSRKAESVSYIMAGSVSGSVGAPLIIFVTTSYAARAHLDPLSVPWLVPPILVVLAILLVSLVKPDSLEIAKNLDKYYPEVDVTGEVEIPAHLLQTTKVFELLKYFPVLASLVSIALAWGNMSMMMSLVSVVLRRNNYELTLISVCVAFHVFGMFGLSIPLGRLADKYDKGKMLVIGSIFLGSGAIITPITSSYWIITLGLFLVGLGWSAVTVTATALIGEVTHPNTLGRIIGLTEIGGGSLSLVFPVVGGLMSQKYGFITSGAIGLLLSLIIFLTAFLLQRKIPKRMV